MPSKRKMRDDAHRPAGVEIPDELPQLTQAAFYLLLACVAARAVVNEYLRDALGTADAPRGPGPATTLWLNLLCCVPALLVLLRRAIDRHYVLRVHWSQLPLLLLGAWSGLSVLWSSDRFAAMVGASTWIAAMVVLWTMTQLVRSWQRVRVVGGVMTGILLALVAQGLIYRFADAPDLQEMWRKEGPRILAERGWEPDSFQARQFERKLLAAEPMGFSHSPNTYATQIVVLGCVVLGLALQRWRDGDESGWVGAAALPLLPAALMPFFTGTKTAAVTALLGVALLVVAIRFGPWLQARQRRGFIVGLSMVVGLTLLVVGYGLATGRLPSAGLNFRWSYWVGSIAMFADHPLLGVGWNNFASNYLPYRVARATEEIRDPHNFVLRFFCELGIVGGLTALAWLLVSAWEATRAATHLAVVAIEPQARSRELRWIGAMIVLSLLIGSLASLDFSLPVDAWLFELLKRVLFAILLSLGLLLAALRGGKQIEIDQRPAPLLSASLSIAALLLLLHSTIDFALFENATTLMFVVLVGSAIGLRWPSHAGAKRRTKVARVALVVALVAWLGVAVFIVWPVSSAEDAAWRADQSARNRRLPEAIALYEQAFDAAPVSNADYLARAAGAMIALKENPARVRATLARASAAEPMSATHHLTRARYERSLADAERDVSAMLAAYAHAVALNPMDLSIRLEYADTLESTGRLSEAQQQWREVLRINDLFDATEPERLSASQIERIESKLK
jgi:O-antigen ligase